MEIASQHFWNPLWFKAQVLGPWDYKQQGDFEHFGNFNYGATGKAAGFPEGILEREAGRAQVNAGSGGGRGIPWLTLRGGLLGEAPFGDDPRDQAWIQMGFEYYDCTH